MSIIDGIIRFDQEFDEVFHLRLIGLHQVAEILEIFHFPCLGPELDLTVAAVVQGNIQDFRDVEERRVVPAFGLMRDLRFDAADDAITAGIFQGDASVHHGRDDDFIVVHSRITQA